MMTLFSNAFDALARESAHYLAPLRFLTRNRQSVRFEIMLEIRGN